jgi:tRNA nucleotidyltransferase/poly(A) polymerase
MTINMYEVGGCVRDELLGVKSKDFDYAVELIHNPPFSVEETFDIMVGWLTNAGFHVFQERPEFGVVRARFPKSAGRSDGCDFVMCRKDGPSSDVRRPDYVEVGRLADDLARRDFTVNAMARPVDLATFQVEPKAVIDPHGGLFDLSIKRLRFVGDPMDRLREDGLRVLRALRFKITKDFVFDQGIRDALNEPETATLLAGVSVERKREELERCFAHDTRATCDLLFHDLPQELLDAIFMDDLRLMPTLKR